MKTLHAVRSVLLGSAFLFAAGAVADEPEPHDKFKILELKVGMPIEQPGFSCTKVKGTDKDTECVKFMDPRCKAAGKIGPRGYDDTPPRGCFLEQQSFATFLDGKLVQQRSEVSYGTAKADPARNPLINLHLYGTRSKPSKIYRIVYTMAMDELASGDKPSGSKLYNALVAKYGEPYEIWSGKVKWRAGQTDMVAYCDLTICWLDVEDHAFAELENREQEERDTKARQGAAPEPKL